ncbi:DMT family transporter [Asaia astilbis]|uniref:DMT family transporter n=1 Tax=Asaia astilbis TaxID=610244 RepID=UPI00046FB237|nr:DMT family transporter [Asaia astilbis]
MSFAAGPDRQPPDALPARLALLLIALLWGLNYIATNFGLRAFSPWTLRALSYLAGAAVLALLAQRLGTKLRVSRSLDYMHLIISGLFACGGFGALSALAIEYTSTGRTAICVYTMPIWVAVGARLVLKEPLTIARSISLILCGAGLLVLLWPLIQNGGSLGALAAVGSAVSWAIGIVYLKWAQVVVHPLTTAIYQLAAGGIVSLIGMMVTGLGVDVSTGFLPWLGLLYGILAGTALAYPLWFNVIDRLPASTAGLGTLLVPVFGVGASAFLLGEKPTWCDLSGLTAILLAATIALRAPTRSIQT